MDCYSATAGVTEGVVPQPYDLTNVSIYLTTLMEKLGYRQVTILLDSLIPIFSETESKHAISFIQSIAAKVKKAGGKLIVTLSTGSVHPELFRKVESLVDGVVELRMENGSASDNSSPSTVRHRRRERYTTQTSQTWFSLEKAWRHTISSQKPALPKRFLDYHPSEGRMSNSEILSILYFLRTILGGWHLPDSIACPMY